jgi:hypothetical protein
MTQNNNYKDYLIDFIKTELLNSSDFQTEIIKPLYGQILYYILPLIIVVSLINFLATMIAVFIVLKFCKC